VYQALYRKYRPRRFCDNDEQIGVVGQEHITETLRWQLSNDRLSHAYLFVGTRGTGKTTCAKILARAVNCMNSEDGEPCNKCIICIGIEDGTILDVLEMDAASHNGVDDVRALRDEAIYTPATAKKRVYIIDEVHMLSTPAFNALLKILEEPPEHILFILATTELHKVPATILSRCQNFSFKRISPDVIANRLTKIAEKENLTITAEAVEKLSALADGSMRNGISLLDQCASKGNIDLPHVRETLGLAGNGELIDILQAVASGEVTKALGVVDILYNDGKDMASLLGDIAMLVRNVLVYKLDANSTLLNGSFEKKDISALCDKMSPNELFFCLDILKNAIFSLSRSGVTKLAAEMCVIKMCNGRVSERVGNESFDVTTKAKTTVEVTAKTSDVTPVEDSIEEPVQTPVETRVEVSAEIPVENVRQETVLDEAPVIQISQETPKPPPQQGEFPWSQHLSGAGTNEASNNVNEKLSKLDDLKIFGANIED